MRSQTYQIILIFLGLATTALLGVFFYREIFPEYKIYQNAYVELEEFRSTYTGQPPPPFQKGVKQIVLEREDKGPAIIDRCTSCHVALKFSHFSPTEIAYDINGNMILDEQGHPVQEPNPNYIWAKLDEKIADLKEADPSQAESLEALKTAHVGEHTYDMTKVLRMHPLIGRETRPFEFHPVEEYGCVSCHNGNGRSLTSAKAHGPVFDGDYEEEFMGPEPEFFEIDEQNDPKFARVFNAKPGHQLLFQTTPLYVGALIQAKCMECHQSSSETIQGAVISAGEVAKLSDKKSKSVEQAFQNEKLQLTSLLTLKQEIIKKGYPLTREQLEKSAQDYTLPQAEREQAETQLTFLKKAGDSSQALAELNAQILSSIGSKQLVRDLDLKKTTLDTFIEKYRNDPKATGTLFAKAAAANLNKEIKQHVRDTEESFEKTVEDQGAISAIVTDIDLLTQNYHRGKSLFLSQGCYACHRITGLSRGGIGPELTEIGNYYPWYIKESIVWPQANLKTSTMPRYNIDHDELEDLMTFLLAQRGQTRAVSESNYKVAVQEWESGRKKAWEKPIPPEKLHDLNYSMTIFVTEGCASCHRMKGFDSNVGFSVEKNNPPFETLYQEKEWFQKLFPETIIGSDIVKIVEEHASEIDQRIVDNIRQNSIIEEIEKKHPSTIEAFYPNFKFAMRAKNHIPKETEAWQERMHRVLMMYIQEYGMGRLIAPRPNWSGVYRSDEWLIGHFRKPSAYTARSIMPVMPFDDTKFYALTYMLNVLAQKNRDAVREIWQHRGFDPKLAAEIYCAQCHGKYLHGNGPVAEWIYPIPKNLRNADFLRNLTKENVIQSLIHGIKGTPMPPWGETPQDKSTYDGMPVLSEHEIEQLVDWLFSSLSGGAVIKGSEDVPKWQYSPEDAIQEIEQEGNILEPNVSMKAHDPEPLALLGAAAPLNAPAKVSEVFDTLPSPTNPDENAYFIKKKFYTDKNFLAGQQYFEVNCAVCHGKEADGAGFRAGTMFDAKPRMLTNLKWLDSRDDLRLLRSIKYGVAGTSMTPWGDLTSSLQRMQLVIFIRMVSSEQQAREELFSSLYQAFDQPQQLINEARIDDHEQLAMLQNQQKELQKKFSVAYSDAQAGVSEPKVVVDLYKHESELFSDIRNYEAIDQILIDLEAEIAQEQEIFRNIGVNLIPRGMDSDAFQAFLKILSLQKGRYTLKDRKLTFNFDTPKEEALQTLANTIIQDVTTELDARQAETTEDPDERIALNAEIHSLSRLKHTLIAGFAEAKRLREKQQHLVNTYNQKLEEMKNDRI